MAYFESLEIKKKTLKDNKNQEKEKNKIILSI